VNHAASYRPFHTLYEENLTLLLKSTRLHSVPGVTLTETNMNFDRIEHGSSPPKRADSPDEIRDRRSVPLSFAGNEIQKRSYPNSFGGQYQSKGYELSKNELLENRAAW